MAIVYYDAYLKKWAECKEMETRAYAEVDALDPDSTFSTEWRDKLMVLKNYIFVCLDNQGEPEDLFSAKYKSYTKEFETALAQARIAAAESDSSLASPLISTVPLERA